MNYLAVINVPYVGIKVATAEKRAATDRALNTALRRPMRSPNIPHTMDPKVSASRVMDTTNSRKHRLYYFGSENLKL